MPAVLHWHQEGLRHFPLICSDVPILLRSTANFARDGGSETWGHFTLWPLLERTKDFNNVIGGEQKFVRSTFIVEGQWLNDNALQNAYMATLFVSFGVKSLSNGGIFVCNIYGNPHSPQADKLFFPNLYKLHHLNIFYWTSTLMEHLTNYGQTVEFWTF
jgi:hypothetical protein